MQMISYERTATLHRKLRIGNKSCKLREYGCSAWYSCNQEMGHLIELCLALLELLAWTIKLFTRTLDLTANNTTFHMVIDKPHCL